MALVKDNTTLGKVLKEIQENTDPNRYNELFIKLVGALRPNGGNASDRVNYLADRLDQEKAQRDAMRKMMFGLLNQRDCHTLFTDTGILTGHGFFTDFFTRIKHRVLPVLPDKRSLEYVLQQAFHKRDDYEWVRAVPDDLWMRLFAHFSFNIQKESYRLVTYLANALTILSYRVSSIGLEEEFSHKFLKEETFNTPFLEQNNGVLQMIEAFRRNDQEALNSHAFKVLVALNECDAVLNNVRRNSARFGTSLSQTYMMVRAEQQLQRMRFLIALLRTGDEDAHEVRTSVAFFKNIVEAQNKRYSIRELINNNVGLLAYQITEHKSASGEHYIAPTRRMYGGFFYAGAGGGIIIAFVAFIKTLLYYLHAAPIWEYFWYSVNYTFGFIAIQETGSILATKQPAMTAATLAGHLDRQKQKNEPSLPHAAHAFVVVSRSQIISFFGNMIIVFPLAYILCFLYELAFGDKLLEGVYALRYVHDCSPLYQPVYYYGALMGVFLFLSGIISGYVDNKVRHSQIGSRMREHRFLKKIFPTKRLGKVANHTERNLGGWIGNVALGFFLGYSTLIGISFGIPFDTYHVTITTARFAIGLYGLENSIPLIDAVWSVVGIFIIGFFNFAVSFSLAFWVAARSRGIRSSQYLPMLKLVLKYLRKHPLDFIRPPKESRKVEEVLA